MKKKIKLDSYELRLIFRALNEFRNIIIREGEYDTEPIDELMILFSKKIN